MLGTVLLIICALSFSGILSKYGAMEVILQSLKKKIKSVGHLVSSTVAATILMALATGRSYMTILIPGELFKDLYKQKGLAPKNLSRQLEDSGAYIVPIVPWSIAGTFMAGTLGMSTFHISRGLFFATQDLCLQSFTVLQESVYQSWTIQKNL